MSRVYFGVGSNVGDRLENIREAIRRLSARMKILRESSVYETSPLEITDQPDFLNAVLEAETDLSWAETLSVIKKIEADMGREKTIRFGPRNIDIDILFYDDVVMDTPGLTIPHPRMHTRAFVLEPLSEIVPEYVHPLLKKTVAQIYSGLHDETQRISRLDAAI